MFGGRKETSARIGSRGRHLETEDAQSDGKRLEPVHDRTGAGQFDRAVSQHFANVFNSDLATPDGGEEDVAGNGNITDSVDQSLVQIEDDTGSWGVSNEARHGGHGTFRPTGMSRP